MEIRNYNQGSSLPATPRTTSFRASAASRGICTLIERTSRSLDCARDDNRKACQRQRGVALLAVLWLVMALSLVALSTSYLVRTEIGAVQNQVEDQQGYYLARGGIEAAVYSILRSALAQGSPGPTFQPVEFTRGQRWLHYDFPGGRCWVEVVAENGKLNVNGASPEQLAALFNLLGLSPAESVELASAIVDWRTPRASDAGSVFDAYYAALPNPYRAAHMPLMNLEELLPVRGMSTDLFFGHVERLPDGELRKTPPLRDLLTTEPTGAVNANYASSEVLRVVLGWDEATANAVLQARAVAPFQSLDELQAVVPQAAAVNPTLLAFGPGPFYTLTATAALKDSSVRRSVRALVRVSTDLPLYHRVLAWWDDWPSPNQPPPAAAAASRTQS